MFSASGSYSHSFETDLIILVLCGLMSCFSHLYFFSLLKNPAVTSLGWLAGLSWFKLEVAGFSWSPSLA